MPKAKISCTSVLLVLLFISCSSESNQLQETQGFYKPWEQFDSLYHQVEMSGIYPDSKTFPDCFPLHHPQEIAQAYQRRKAEPNFDLEQFVKDNFKEPKTPTVREPMEQENFREHLINLWEELTRASDESAELSTLINLPGKYVVPGGRFREIYYWDSYFTMIGLAASGRADLVGLMVDNFAYLIDSVGFIPNGNRTYYLSRSQPPYFAAMVNLLGKPTTEEKTVKYLRVLQKEYNFWMKGTDLLSQEYPARGRVVRLQDGSVLNRYFDDLNSPRPESYKEDFEMAQGLSVEDKMILYRNLRAGAESGWDYSTRWFEDPAEFESIRTIEVVPVDLNCLIYNMERTLAELYQLSGDQESSRKYNQKALNRYELIRKVFWNEDLAAFTDYIWTEARQSDQITMAGAYPLYFKIATDEQADYQARTMADKLLLPGGFVTTTIHSGQQWDYPNGWAPLQWIGIKGLEHYGKEQLARNVTKRWVQVNKKVYQQTGKMMEKYNVADTTLIAGGGEYPTQDGFGWTNGVVLGLMDEDPIY